MAAGLKPPPSCGRPDLYANASGLGSADSVPSLAGSLAGRLRSIRPSARAHLKYQRAGIDRATPLRNRSGILPSISFRVHIENFRCLRSVDLKLEEGVSVLIGPNGAGKTTLLAALKFMRDALMDGPGAAVEHAGGGGSLKNFEASEDAPVLLEYESEETRWSLRAFPKAGGITLPAAEQLFVGGKLVVEQKPGDSKITIDDRPYERTGETQGSSAARYAIDLKPLLKLAGFSLPRLRLAIVTFGIFHDPDLHRLRNFGSQIGAESELNSRGANLFNVLRNWQAGERPFRKRMEFVRYGLRDAFPDLFDDLDFQVAGQTVSARFYMPGNQEPLSVYAAPNGLLAGMIHLAAVASAAIEGSIVAIDEFENSLHPHAIHSLVRSISERAAEHHLTVILSSHSPVLLNCFKDQPSRIFVVEPGSSPSRLDEKDDPDWLAQFSLGDLYANEDIGAPRLKPPADQKKQEQPPREHGPSQS